MKHRHILTKNKKNYAFLFCTIISNNGNYKQYCSQHINIFNNSNGIYTNICSVVYILFYIDEHLI